MIRTAERQRFLATCLFLVALFAVSITPIRSYDYFWHLAAGNWILDQGTLPETDPFSVSSDPVTWIDGEWFFQIAAALVDRVGGSTGTSVVRGVCVALIFSIGFAALLRRVEPAAALFVSIVAVWGADHRLTTRPETVATLFLAVALWILFEWKPGSRAAAAYALLTVIWMANHPSALLAPAVAGLVLGGRFIAGERGPELGWRAGVMAAGGFALLLNPWGLEGVLAPLRLASLVGAGTFVNIEWTATKFADFPLVYFSAGAVVALLVWKRDWKDDAARILLFAFFAVLAFRYVRNHGFFFAVLPFVVASRLPTDLPTRVRRALSVATAALFVGLVWQHQGIRVGVDEDQFPVASVSHLRAVGLEGKIYNPDQLGGYLIWSFYPERRVLTDGRNELHVSYIDEYSKARLDQREWNALLDRYGIALAVDEYHRETIDVVDAVTGERQRMPISLIYFPRGDWALIGFDDVAMVFARRGAFDAGLIERLEFRSLVPDAMVPVIDLSPETLMAARKEIERARDQFGEQDSIERIERLLGVPQETRGVGAEPR